MKTRLPAFLLLLISLSAIAHNRHDTCATVLLKDETRILVTDPFIDTNDCSMVYKLCNNTSDDIEIIDLATVEYVKNAEGKYLYKNGQVCGKNLLNHPKTPDKSNNWSDLLWQIGVWFGTFLKK